MYDAYMDKSFSIHSTKRNISSYQEEIKYFKSFEDFEIDIEIVFFFSVYKD